MKKWYRKESKDILEQYKTFHEKEYEEYSQLKGDNNILTETKAKLTNLIRAKLALQIYFKRIGPITADAAEEFDIKQYLISLDSELKNLSADSIYSIAAAANAALDAINLIDLEDERDKLLSSPPSRNFLFWAIPLSAVIYLIVALVTHSFFPSKIIFFVFLGHMIFLGEERRKKQNEARQSIKDLNEPIENGRMSLDRFVNTNIMELEKTYSVGNETTEEQKTNSTPGEKIEYELIPRPTGILGEFKGKKYMMYSHESPKGKPIDNDEFQRLKNEFDQDDSNHLFFIYPEKDKFFNKGHPNKIPTNPLILLKVLIMNPNKTILYSHIYWKFTTRKTQETVTKAQISNSCHVAKMHLNRYTFQKIDDHIKKDEGIGYIFETNEEMQYFLIEMVGQKI